MKKSYEKPDLHTQQFDLDDVVAASGAPQQSHPLNGVSGRWETSGFGLN